MCYNNISKIRRGIGEFPRSDTTVIQFNSITASERKMRNSKKDKSKSDGQFSVLLRMWVTRVYALPKLREWFTEDQDILLLSTFCLK